MSLALIYYFSHSLLDVTGHELYATEIAKRIRKKNESETGLTGSAGVAANKLIAKIASDVNKPNGLTVVIPEKSKAFMRNLRLCCTART